MGVIAVFALVLRKEEDLESVGRRAVDCAIQSDADCLFPLVMEPERAALRLDRRSFRAFLEGWFRDRFQVASSEPYGYQGASKELGKVSVSRKVRFEDGSSGAIDLTVVDTDSGPRIPGLVTQLWMAAILYPAKAAGKAVHGPHRYSVLKNAAEQEGGRLAGLGLKGLVLSDSESALTWDQLSARFDEKAKELQKRVSSDSIDAPSSDR